MKKETYTLTLTHSEMIDIRMAMIAARVAANDGGRKWMDLREKIIAQMAEQEKQEA